MLFFRWKQEFSQRKIMSISLCGIFTSFLVASRFILQFIPNIKFNVALTIVSGVVLGPFFGFLTGFMSMFISDFLIVVGPWTFIDSFLMGFIGFLSGKIWFKKNNFSKLELAMAGLLLTVFYDIFSSIAVMSIFGLPWYVSVINLYLPTFIGGIPYPFGPIHELSNAFFTSILTPVVVRELGKVKIYG